MTWKMIYLNQKKMIKEIDFTTIEQYLSKAIEVSNEVMIDYDKQFRLQKAIFFLNLELAKIQEQQIINTHNLNMEKANIWEDERKKHNTDRSTTEAINKILQTEISKNTLNQNIIDKKIIPTIDSLIRLSSAVKDERINQMSQAKITWTFTSKEWY